MKFVEIFSLILFNLFYFFFFSSPFSSMTQGCVFGNPLSWTNFHANQTEITGSKIHRYKITKNFIMFKIPMGINYKGPRTFGVSPFDAGFRLNSVKFCRLIFLNM
uniref:Uncharacterized protein n=1 Tax=Cacopsylla melanoneura TaxID=428564 RepID=A0A8D9DY62_9HEMI